MNCLSCNSIWLRPAEPAWLHEGTHAWTRRFQCGGCGAVYLFRVTRIGQAESDHTRQQRKQAEGGGAPAPKLMLGNGEPAA